MAKDNFEGAGALEIKALKEKAETIKHDTLEFINSAKNLSHLGIKDAKSLVNFAKANWKSVLGVAAALGIGGALLRKKRKSSRKGTSSKGRSPKKRKSGKRS